MASSPPPALLVRELPAYEPHIACGPGPVTVYLGARLALVVDHGDASLAAECARNVGALGAVVADLEAMLAAFDATVGRVPPVTRPFEGRVRCEVAFLQNAAGLAHHGVAGWAVGPEFLRLSLRSRATPAPFLHQVFAYEACRNYIFPDDFTTVLDYACDEGPEQWGWVNQGFVNVLGCCLLADVGIGFDYWGRSGDQFMGDMVAHLERYRASGLPWGAVFRHVRLPWDAATSLDNVYSGLLVTLWRRHGRGRFLRRWFRGALPLLRARCPASKADVSGAADNFFLAACYAAGADLTADFVGGLRWPLTPGAAGPALEAVLAAAAADGGA